MNVDAAVEPQPERNVVLLLADGQRKVVTGSPFRIGRDIDQSHLYFSSPVVSSAHAIITLPGRAGHSPSEVFKLLGGPAVPAATGKEDPSLGADVLAYITDLSTNGTWVNDQRIPKGDPVPLHKGNKVSLDPRLASVLESFAVHAECEEAASEKTLKREKTMPMDWADPPATEGSAVAPAQPASEAFLELIKCPICLDVQFNTVTAVPCLHEACSPCAYRYSATECNPSKNRCPICKQDISAWRVNHAQRQRIEIFLQENPQHRRSKEEEDTCRAAKQVPSQVSFRRSFCC